jgi:hypothetical protein
MAITSTATEAMGRHTQASSSAHQGSKPDTRSEQQAAKTPHTSFEQRKEKERAGKTDRECERLHSRREGVLAVPQRVDLLQKLRTKTTQQDKQCS